MGAEHAAVRVALVDDDETQAAQEAGPRGVVGQDAVVQHVGVGEDDPGVLAGPVALLPGGVAVVGGGADAGQVEGLQRAELVGGQGLGRGEVQHRRLVGGEQGGEGRQLVREGLARPGAGGDDGVGAGPRGLGGDGLVGPREGDAAGGEGGAQRRWRPVGPGGGGPGAGRHVFDVGERFGAAGR